MIHHFYVTSDFQQDPDYGHKDDDIFGKIPSKWQPKKTSTTITEFVDEIKAGIIQRLQQKTKSNITRREAEAIESLRHKNITIRPADKNAGTCVLNETDYIEKCLALLNVETDYEIVDNPRTTEIHQKANQILKIFRDIRFITDKQYDFATNFTPKTPCFYGNPKIHKPGRPMRPIVSQINGPTSRLNQLADYILSKTENHVDSLIRDTPEFINNIINVQIPDDAILVTLDVASLYTRIPWKEGVNYVVDEYITHDNGINPDYLRMLLTFILENNCFVFNGTHYHQSTGTSMGARVAVKYANIYMGRKWIDTIAQAPFKPLTYFRLIDDIFIIWTHGITNLLNFHSYINQQDPNIQFELKYSSEEITFLDTVVYVDNHRLYTKNYTKPTNKQMFLHADSAHPQHLKKSLPYSQALRIRRNTTDNHILQQQLEHITNAFIKRGYRRTAITANIQPVYRFQQADLLRKKPPSTMERTPLILPYHPSLANINIYTRQKWETKILSKPSLAIMFDDYPIVAFKKTQTIGSKITSSLWPPRWRSVPTTERPTPTNHSNTHTEPIESPPLTVPIRKTLPCQDLRCKTCIYIQNHYPPSHDGPTTFTCRTHNCIYLATCAQCSQNYVGQTSRTLAQRITDHRSNIRRKIGTTLATHINQHKKHTFTVRILEVVDDPQTRLTRELFWQNTLKTDYPSGINGTPCSQTGL